MWARRLGRKAIGSYFDFLLLLRPRQWPILSFQLAVGVLAAPALAGRLTDGTATDGTDPVRWSLLAGAWIAWVVCLNGGTLAFNSAYDRDVEDIAYLHEPPQPPRGLAAFAGGLMAAGAAIAFAVSPALGIVTIACCGLSVLYSHPRCRWKGVPGLDLLVNMVGYGGGTTLAGLLVGQAAVGPVSWPDPAGWAVTVAFALLFGSFYPLTQIYQIADDDQRGDRTLASALGTGRALALATLLGLAACPAFLFVASSWSRTGLLPAVPLAATLIIWHVNILVWRRRAERMSTRDHERGMYTALAIWAAVDVAILACRYGTVWTG